MSGFGGDKMPNETAIDELVDGNRVAHFLMELMQDFAEDTPTTDYDRGYLAAVLDVFEVAVIVNDPDLERQERMRDLIVTAKTAA
jgi:hypothetical protein